MDDYNNSVFNIIIQRLLIVGDMSHIVLVTTMQAARSFLNNVVGIYKLVLILTSNYIK